MNVNEFNSIMNKVKESKVLTEIPETLFVYFLNYGHRLARGVRDQKFIILDKDMRVWIWTEEDNGVYLYYHFYRDHKTGKYSAHLKEKENLKKE